MDTREFFVITLTDEIPRFVRVLEAVPHEADKTVWWKPDPKSRTALELASLIAAHSSMISTLLTSDAVTAPSDPPEIIDDMPELISNFTLFMTKAKETAADIPNKEWDSETRMLSAAGEEEWKAPRGVMIWALLLDLIHHRGQLSTYIRPMGGSMPSIYGQSADSKT
jgi:hypothetical protein